MMLAKKSKDASAISSPIRLASSSAPRFTPPIFKTAMAPRSSSKPFTISSPGCATSIADSAYSGDKLAKALTQFGRWTIEIVKRDAPGFVVLPRRWVVERTLAWLNRNRRLAKDFEASIASAKAWLYLASIQLLIRRLARR